MSFIEHRPHHSMLGTSCYSLIFLVHCERCGGELVLSSLQAHTEEDRYWVRRIQNSPSSPPCTLPLIPLISMWRRIFDWSRDYHMQWLCVCLSEHPPQCHAIRTDWMKWDGIRQGQFRSSIQLRVFFQVDNMIMPSHDALFPVLQFRGIFPSSG